MRKLIPVAAALFLAAGAAQATEPVTLTASDMDRVTAGGGGNPYNALLAALPGGFTLDGAQLNHIRAKLRFQPVEENKGIAIPGGANANFDKSVLREAGDGFGAVVVLY